MEGLTLDNYWNLVKDKYPDQLRHFTDWVDDYKRNSEWSSLFRDGVKFHELPLELQAGIICLYINSFYTVDEINPIDRNELTWELNNLFAAKYINVQLDRHKGTGGIDVEELFDGRF